jgi:anion-transporting  ArsA/GET3 family ATPase
MSDPRANGVANHEDLARIIREKRIIVCCGAGGVGKTTTAAAIALSAARQGRKVLVLTIDPSRRLAETLGVARNPPAPVPLAPERRALAGITTGSLDCWLLDPKLVADETVRKLARTPEEAERFLSNRIYKNVTQMVAGMHEYTAMEELHKLVQEGRYELFVLDTPPSRHALDFLEAPRRLARVLEGRVFAALMPKKNGILTRAASRIVERALTIVFGAEFAADFTGFVATFSGLFSILSGHLSEMRSTLTRPDVAFLLVCSPAPATLTEAFFFQDKTNEMNLPFRGFVLNRSRARTGGRTMPEERMLGPDPSPDALSGLAKLQEMARVEQAAAARDQQLLEELKTKAGDGALAAAVPELPQGADDMSTLVAVADALAA